MISKIGWGLGLVYLIIITIIAIRLYWHRFPLFSIEIDTPTIVIFAAIAIFPFVMGLMAGGFFGK